MKQETKSSKVLRQRRFYLVLPILVLPFITLLFWVMGGGKEARVQSISEIRKGLDLTLPATQADGKKYLTKMDYYHQATLDSTKRREQIKNDPYYNDTISLHNAETGDQTDIISPNDNVYNSSDLYSRYTDPNEAKVYQKLKQLNAVLNKADTIPVIPPDEYSEIEHPDTTTVSGTDIDRLERMMQAMDQPEGPDPEMKQLNSMLEKILDIQHPNRVQDKIIEASKVNNGQVFVVSADPKTLPISSLDGKQVSYSRQNGFYSLDDHRQVSKSMNSIPAAAYETQTIVNGSTVKLRLLNDIYINGVLVPRNNFLFGEATLDGERLKIEINSVRYKNSLFPVQLSVYDLDGLDGIYIPGAITRNVVKQSADRAAQSIGMTSVDPSLGAQAASAGIEAARSLLGKKIKLMKVTVKSGYHVLLRDDNQKQRR